ncbi:uncharacterized protein LOC124137154 isoform X3 [Haliotis rufescens]|uniref:uncharacterized protein LOC124137154 isoform X3 n=1 Tax=Haliotis rufescens TaxID=6454 RepID=UPI00201EE0E5|nr:uncharacterized protein LOC124137154 isoform X3 [Haliotis rufescens]
MFVLKKYDVSHLRSNSSSDILLAQMERSTSHPVVFVLLTSIIFSEIKDSTQSVTQPCERNKRAISLCESSSDNRDSGYLTYNMSASPVLCNCSLATGQEVTLNVQYAETVHNATYDFVFDLARGDGGSIRGKEGHWEDRISKRIPWTLYLSKANLKVELPTIQGLCFSYEVRNGSTTLIIVFLCVLTGALAVTIVTVVFFNRRQRRMRSGGRFSTRTQDEILTALQKASSWREDKGLVAAEEGLERMSSGCDPALPDHTGQGASEVIHDGGTANKSSDGGYSYAGPTSEPGTLGDSGGPDGDAQTGPSAEGDGVGKSDDDRDEIEMVDNILYETSCIGGK